MTTDHEEMEQLLAAWTLGSTSTEEADQVRAHLETCERCQAVARRLGRSVGALPVAVEQASPPARLRERVLSAAQATTQLEAAPRPPRRHAPRPSLPPARIHRLWNLPAVAAAALIAFALGAGIGVGVGRTALAPPVARPAEVVQYSLTGSGPMAGSSGRVFDLRGQEITLIQFNGMPSLASGRVYELWLIDSHGHPQPGAVFSPEADGSKVLLLGRSVSGLAALAVTDEAGPAGASAPSSQPQLVGKI